MTFALFLLFISLMLGSISGRGNDAWKSGTWCAAAAETTASRYVRWSTSSVPASSTTAVDIFVVSVASSQRADGASTGRDGRRRAAAASAAARRRHGDAVSAAGRLVRPGRLGVDRLRDGRRHGRQPRRAAPPHRPRPTRRSQSRSVCPRALRIAASQRTCLTSALTRYFCPAWAAVLTHFVYWSFLLSIGFWISLAA